VNLHRLRAPDTGSRNETQQIAVATLVSVRSSLYIISSLAVVLVGVVSDSVRCLNTEKKQNRNAKHPLLAAKASASMIKWTFENDKTKVVVAFKGI
jgi:hypothetical protein